jgi:hypothetical protein
MMWKKCMIPFLLLTMALPVSALSKGSYEKTAFVHPNEVAVTQEVQGRWMLKEKAVFPNNTGKESWTQISLYIGQPVYTKAFPEPQVDFSHFGEVSYLPAFQTVMLAAPDYTESYYVGNARTMKFHISSCRWAKKISAKNRTYFDTRDDAVNSGYVPCKVCMP